GVPDSTPMQIFIVGAMLAANNIVFEFSNAFHGAMLPSIAPASRLGGLSGLAFALGSGAGFLLMIVFLVCFIAPGVAHWSFLPAHPLFGLDAAAHEPERLAGPISALWMLLLAIP